MVALFMGWVAAVDRLNVLKGSRRRVQHLVPLVVSPSERQALFVLRCAKLQESPPRPRAFKQHMTFGTTLERGAVYRVEEIEDLIRVKRIEVAQVEPQRLRADGKADGLAG